VPRVRVKYFGYLADYAGAPEVEVDAPPGARVRDVVKLPPDVSIDDVVVLVNGRPASPDQELGEGDTVSVLPHISGGRSSRLGAPGSAWGTPR